jgi:type I restriction enzyme M protein
VRFKNHGCAPKSAADFALRLYGLHYLKADGVMAINLPQGGAVSRWAEERVRTYCLNLEEPVLPVDEEL